MKLVIPFFSPLDSGKPPLYSKIANFLQNKYGVEIIAVTFGESSRKFILDECRNIKFHGMYDLNEFLIKISKDYTINEQELISLEAKYGIPNLWLYAISAQVSLSGLDYETILNILALHIKFWEDVFKKEKPDAFIDEGICGLILTVYKVAERYNVSILNIQSSRITNRFIINDNPFDKWKKMERIFSILKERQLTQEEKSKAESFLEKFTTQRQKPSYMHSATSHLKTTFKAPLTIFKYFYGYYISEGGNGYFLRTPFNMIRDHLTRIYRFKLAKLMKMWEEPVEGEKFILYPIHFQPEASTLVLAPFYIDQPALIENIAKSIPADFKLYVKEHKSNLGMRPLSYYDSIKKNPNVRLITPFVDSHELIKKASVIVTITSTMGWEAIIYQKPVVTVGNVFYNAFDLVYTVKDISTLPYVLKEAITGYRPDRELLLKFILAVLEGTYEGEMVWDIQSAISEQNIENLCKSIATEMGLVFSRNNQI